MKIIYSKSFDKSLKKLKKHHKELKVLNKLINDLTNYDYFSDLINDNYIKTYYKFERLKYNNKNFYSFNLNRNGGKIRLIVEQKDEDCIMLYISTDHYNDFNERKVIYYD